MAMIDKIRSDQTTEFLTLSAVGTGITLSLTIIGKGINDIFFGIGSIYTSALVANAVRFGLEKSIEDKDQSQTLIKVARYALPTLAALCVNYMLFGLGTITVPVIVITQLTLTYFHENPDSFLHKNYNPMIFFKWILDCLGD